jgi:hypothetical protein
MKVVKLNVEDISRQLGGNYFSQKRIFVRGGGHPLFSRLLHFAIPLIQRAGRYLFKKGADAAETGYSRFKEGKNLKESFKAGAKRAYDNTKEDLEKLLGGSAKRRRKITL